MVQVACILHTVYDYNVHVYMQWQMERVAKREHFGVTSASVQGKIPFSARPT